MTLQTVLAQAAAEGLPIEGLVVGTDLGRLPQAPSGPWVVVPLEDGGTALGAYDRGQFAMYGVYDDAAASRALRHVLTVTSPARPLHARQRERLAQEASILTKRLQDAASVGRPIGCEDVPIGTALDHIGPDSGHVLFLLDTPFSRRSAPPTDLQLPRTGYLLTQPLPPEASVSPVVPWFGQPGGGIMVALDHPIRWYCDSGLLEPFVP